MTGQFSLTEVFLVAGYVAVFFVLILRWRFFRNAGLSSKFLLAMFLLKVAAAIGYGLFHWHAGGGGDTFAYFSDGKLFAQHGRSHPGHYIELVFGPSGGRIPDHLRSVHQASYGFWSDSGSYMMVRFHALASLISFGHYYVHAVFMAFLSLIGLTAFYRFVRSHLTHCSWIVPVLIFAFPSILFYGSGLHKEALLVFALGLILWHWDNMLKPFRWYRAVAVMLLLTFTFFLKTFYFATLIPVLVAYAWVNHKPAMSLLKYALVISLYWTVAFTARYISSFDLADRMSKEQSEFTALKTGRTDIDIPLLDGSLRSTAVTVPYAIVNTMLRPWPSDVTEFPHRLYMAEQWFILLLILFTVGYLNKRDREVRNPAWLLLFFAITVFLIIGAIVPNYGAISRYKAPALLCLICGLVLLIDWRRLKDWRLKDCGR